jgi:hypothetical protein
MYLITLIWHLLNTIIYPASFKNENIKDDNVCTINILNIYYYCSSVMPKPIVIITGFSHRIFRGTLSRSRTYSVLSRKWYSGGARAKVPLFPALVILGVTRS